MAHHITDADGNLIEVAGNFKDADINTVIANFQKQIDNLEQKLSKRYLVDSYVSSDGNTWYNIYSDGWKECGGRLVASNDGEVRTTNFPVSFSSIPTLNVTFSFYEGDALYQYIVPRNISKTSFTITIYSSNSQGTSWEAKGY